jgi:putative alpha-1,2-mannosidase
MGMKRREVLKRLTTVAGGTMLPASAWSVLAQPLTQNANLPRALPIRAFAGQDGAGTGRQPVDDVNPFIGTTAPGLRWMLFPGAAMPFGMVKLSPDNKAWSGRAGSVRAGYDYKIPTIPGFSHIHSWAISGQLMMPATGPMKIVQGPESGSPESFRSRFRHETESASPGYYAVTLDDYGVRCELTAMTREGFLSLDKIKSARLWSVFNC